MGVDEKKRGVPVAFLMFSAPSGNKQTSSGYDTEILTKLLRCWRHSLEEFGGKMFEVRVAITDTDLKERAALTAVFPQVWLLLCKFHIRQSWRNYRNKLLKGKAPGLAQVMARMRVLEVTLLQTMDFNEAAELIMKERTIQNAEKAKGSVIASRILSYLEYLGDGYWLKQHLWTSWSEYGRQVASRLLDCNTGGALPTTNHLESFNCVLKRKHLNRWQRGGHRLRVDLLLHLLVQNVLPSIYEQRRFEASEEGHLEALVCAISGGNEVLKARGSKQPSSSTSIIYIIADEDRDKAAMALMQNRYIDQPAYSPEGLLFYCYSSHATVHDAAPVKYQVWLGYDGVVACTCKDLKKRSVACKHIRAALIRVDQLRYYDRVLIPTVPIPRSEAEAKVLASRLTASAAGSVKPAEAPIIKASKAVNDFLDDTFADSHPRMELEMEEVTYDSDLESVATEDGDEFDFNFIESAAKEGVAEQKWSCAYHQLSTITPHLGELATILAGAEVPTKHLDTVILFQSQLQSLSNELERMIQAAQASDPKPIIQETQRKRPRSPSPKAEPQLRRRLLPPSPEKKQKRKDSHSIH
ncbi:hypothetical protein M422DRAFT_265913 [Sphaerobolus stellatus SS14]|uniref:SWIM-type domain-containing protein n=1 Tax=Sphaerobolus stellatus (strain SS14) TaxID=990650 RepID=A0A0C9UC71_SPHS4|nr:hypothetical protein M422DRAFT_265913 [Sphaerobolus stellatus SS14]